MEEPQPFYPVHARSSCESPDPRAKRERMLVELSYRIRDYPTLPAHPDDSNEVWDAALAEDMAVELPQVHCSFRGCPWCATSEDARDTHIIVAHTDELLPIADTLPKCFSQETRVRSVYNGIIATKTRRGAPVSCYAIQRRAVNAYMETISESAIQSPICFICACKFPYVAARKENDISWRNLLSLYLLRINESNLFSRKDVLTSNICLAWKHIWKTTALYRKERCIWGTKRTDMNLTIGW